MTNDRTGLEVAIVGMAGRFPGADTPDAFWRNLRAGVESISRFTVAEMEAAGVPSEEYGAPSYVPAGGTLAGIDLFDADFFGIPQREAELLDPQQRHFLECGWEALESAGHDPLRFRGRIGVYAGSSINTYLLDNLYGNPDVAESGLQLLIGNDKDFAASRLAFKLNLTGPAVVVQSACSTSLVAVHLACQALLGGECDMALAGGVTIRARAAEGYCFEDGMIFSPDGHCRAFDAEGRGTVPGNGAGIVVLRRLEDALRDRDHIYAVIRGSAVNNDGAGKVGYTAPSPDGQAQVIRAAQRVAEVGPDSIGYVETHGTGTPVGDSIEIAALRSVFGAGRPGECMLGSVKTNIGHLDAAAGVAGLIKATLAVEAGEIPPSLHFRAPNPALELGDSVFRVVGERTTWPAGTLPRRAGVSSFGIGGTNAHVVLEEAPPAGLPGTPRHHQLLAFSARSAAALDQVAQRLADHLESHPEAALSDAAYTMHAGRRAFAHRRTLVCASREEAIAELRDGRASEDVVEAGGAPVAFLLPGIGDQYEGMGRDLYAGEAVFRDAVDQSAALLEPELGRDLRGVLYPGNAVAPSALRGGDAMRRMLGRVVDNAEAWRDDPTTLHAAVFTVEYALARLWMSWGVQPGALLGYSLGEYVAATLAGVFTLPEALSLVVRRARLVGTLPRGAMLAVSLPEHALRAELGEQTWVASVNGPTMCVAAGTEEAVAALEARLSARAVVCRRVRNSHAFHSGLVHPILPDVRALFDDITPREPRIRFVSNLTGTWITSEQATDPEYWAMQMSRPVRFADGLSALEVEGFSVLVEAGAGQSLSAQALQRDPRDRDGRSLVAVPSLRAEWADADDGAFILQSLGKLWRAGVEVDWGAFHASGAPRRIPLPTYPFERRRFWVAPAGKGAKGRGSERELADWFYLPGWKRTLPPRPHAGSAPDEDCWLVFQDSGGLGAALVEELRSAGADVVTVAAGEAFEAVGECAYSLDPDDEEGYRRLLAGIRDTGKVPTRVVHCWMVTTKEEAASEDYFELCQRRGVFSLASLARAFSLSGNMNELRLTAVSNGLHATGPGEECHPEKGTLLAPCKVIPQELPNVFCQAVDLAWHGGSARADACRLLAEMRVHSPDPVVAYRGADQRLVQNWDPVRIEAAADVIRDRGVYLVTGGLGSLGLLLAEHLGRTARARLVLVGRSSFPERDRWGAWMDAHGENDPTTRTIRRLLDLEDLGAELWVTSADIADEGAMRAVLSRTLERFGALHGVFHAAGLTGFVRPLSESLRADAEQIFRAKCEGTRVLEQVLEGRQIDFCLLYSSTASILGGPGITAYAAASAYLDSFAARAAARTGIRWLSVNWDGWLTNEVTASETARTSIARYYMPFPDALEALLRVLSAAPAGQVAVSNADFNERVAQWTGPGAKMAKVPAGPEDGTSPGRRLRNEYVAPSSELEIAVAEVWTEVLGVEAVGIHDSFFELGGDSLLGTKTVGRLQGAFGIQVTMRHLWRYPTVEQLALLVEEMIIDQLLAEASPVEET
jgi:acyl transferase domain-containing protein/acyl carrier protein